MKTQNLNILFIVLNFIVIVFSVIFTFKNIDSDTLKNFKDSIDVLLYSISILIPPVIGLWKFRSIEISKIIKISFISYCSIAILGFVNALIADDALAAGLPMVVIVVPMAIVFTICLISILIYKKIRS